MKKIASNLLLLVIMCMFAMPPSAFASVSSIADSIRRIPSKISETDAGEIADAIKALPKDIQAAVLPRYDFKDLVKQVGPAVVNISTERTTTVRQMPMPFGPNSPFDRDFDFFFGPQQNMPQQRRQTSLGSGFIISDDGYIVTNNHVIEGAEVIRINFDSIANRENSYEAKVIGQDKETDLALLKIEAKEKLPFVKFGNSDALEVGEWVMAIGNPFGLDHSVTVGILSAKFRNIDSSSLVRFLQTDASINPGNSGGPLVNMQGEVIGINSAIAAQAQGIGFAIPSTLAESIINDLRTDQKVSRGWLGVSIQPVDAVTAKALGLKKAQGALIGGVMPGQPAARAGIEAGDVILKIDDSETNSPEELQRVIMSKKPGSTVTATVWRDGKSLKIKIKLIDRNSGQNGDSQQQPDDSKQKDATDNDSLGLQLKTLNQQEAEHLGVDLKQGGLMITQVAPEKLGGKAGLRPGDVVLAVGRKNVRSVDEFNKEVNAMLKKQGAVILLLNRGGQQFIRAIEAEK